MIISISVQHAGWLAWAITALGIIGGQGPALAARLNTTLSLTLTKHCPLTLPSQLGCEIHRQEWWTCQGEKRSNLGWYQYIPIHYIWTKNRATTTSACYTINWDIRKEVWLIIERGGLAGKLSQQVNNCSSAQGWSNACVITGLVREPVTCWQGLEFRWCDQCDLLTATPVNMVNRTKDIYINCFNLCWYSFCLETANVVVLF